MARKSAFTLREQLLTLAARYSQKEITEKFGISERSFRRWKNEQGTPSDPEITKTIAKAARSLRDSNRRFQERYSDVNIDGTKLSAPIKQEPKAKKFQEILSAQRRKVRDAMIGYEKTGKKTKSGKDKYREVWTKRLSEYVLYDVKPLTQREQAEFAYALLESGNYVRFNVRGKFYGGRDGWITTDMISPETLKNYPDFESFYKHLKTHNKEGFARANTRKAARIITGYAAFGIHRT